VISLVDETMNQNRRDRWGRRWYDLAVERWDGLFSTIIIVIATSLSTSSTP